MLKQINKLEGYEDVLDCYYISEEGLVYSSLLKRYAKLGDNGRGYKRIGLKMKGVRKWKNAYAHRLVALAFIPNPHNKEQVNHIDENKSNNCLDNLEWVNAKENMNHGTAIERQKASKGSKTYVYNFKGEFLKEFVSISDASKEFLGHRNTRGNCRVGEYVFLSAKPTKELFIEVVERSAYKPVVMTNIFTGEKELFPSQKYIQRKLGSKINICDYVKKGSLFDGRFKFELYTVDRIGMPN